MRVDGAPAKSIQLKQPPASRFSFASSFKDKKDSLRSSSPGRRQSITHSHNNYSPEELCQMARPPTITSPPLSPTFTELADDVFLPFIERPSEVQALIASAPTSKLFALLRKTFPNDACGGIDQDPTTWSFDTVIQWLTGPDRDTVPDALWVRQLRACVLARSELIWERIKGALGVPPELDHDGILWSDDDSTQINTSDVEDGPRIGGVKGPWDDWDSASIDSPSSLAAARHSPILERLSPLPPPMGGDLTSPLIIEPITSSPAGSPFFQAAPSPSINPLDGIREEEESAATLTANTPAVEQSMSPGGHIQGLTISTSPSSPRTAPSRPMPVPPAHNRRSSWEGRPSFGSSPLRHGSPGQSPVLSGRRSRPSSISSFSTMSLGSFPMSPSEERSGPLFPSSFATLNKTRPQLRA
ncbi:hypothetical protein CYLTODRAFT_421208 [Cylindrobasidium torrendii FP15055 ss-10]|uniref:Uncharacterized protein n=1 Tax=Cylindrobasidium torrendii FP15055 ss-10 TaxID=1314674 RepID=A0A0D7BFH2_9AGAR|nr:hypothetical protein CYLTODRAFT_421208 [Cylindrobasidium torrendii FP15055 ss-10]